MGRADEVRAGRRLFGSCQAPLVGAVYRWAVRGRVQALKGVWPACAWELVAPSLPDSLGHLPWPGEDGEG